MPVLRSCSAALATALATAQQLSRADLFTFQLIDGITVYYWTSWDSDLKVGAQLYTSAAPWLRRSKWGLTNTMVIPELDVIINANDALPNLKLQAQQGLFDGATMGLFYQFMPTPGDTATLAFLPMFYGLVGQLQITGSEIQMKIKGKNNVLDRPAPRNTYQATCLHTFCDSGCTLNRANFTASFVVGTAPAPTTTFIPWNAAPGTPAVYTMGSVKMTSGAATGLTRSIVKADSTGLTLAYPLPVAPAHLDAFSAFEGCDKTLGPIGGGIGPNGGTNCTLNGNVVNFRGFPYIPPPSNAARGSF